MTSARVHMAAWLIGLTGVATADAAAPGPLGDKLKTYSRELERYRRHGDVVDNLYYRLYDQPYLRATLACLLKTEQCLRRHAAAIRAGEPGPYLPEDENADVALADILAWCDDALARVAAWREPADWRPNRLRVDAHTLHWQAGRPTVSGRPMPLIGFLDGSGSLGFSDRLGDLDLIACLGGRWVAIADVGPARRKAVLARCSDLGIGVVEYRSVRAGMGEPSSVADLLARWRRPADDADGATVAIVATTRDHSRKIAALFGQTEPAFGDGNGLAVSIEVPGAALWQSRRLLSRPVDRPPSFLTLRQSDRSGGSLADVRLQRRAIEAVAQAPAVLSAPWPLVRPSGHPARDARAVRAHLFVDLLTGSPGGFVGDWVSPIESPRSLLARPWLTEAIAHTALDALRLGDTLTRFPAETEVGVLFRWPDRDVAKPAIPSASVRAVCRRLDEARVPYRLVPVDALSDSKRLTGLRVLVVEDGLAIDEPLPAERDDVTVLTGSAEDIANRVRQLRKEGTVLVDQVMAVDPDGRVVRGLATGSTRTAQGTLVFYAVNLSLQPRRIGLEHRGQPLRGEFENLVTRSKRTVGPDGLSLAPYEVWIGLATDEAAR